MRLLELVEQHDRVGRVAQRGRQRAIAGRADIAARLAEQAGGGVRLAELGHVEEMQVAARAVQLLGQDLGEVGLAGAGRPGEAEHRDRLVLAPRREAAAQLARDGVDHVVLADHLRLQPRGERLGVDHGQLRGAGLVFPRENVFVGQAVKHIHEEPRESLGAIEQYADGARSRESDHRQGERDRRLRHHQDEDDHEKAEKPWAGAH